MLTVGFGLETDLFLALTFDTPTTGIFGLIILGGALLSTTTFFPLADLV
jgi:hypothetical protein